MNGHLRRLLSDKTATVWPLPEWMLPPERVEALRREPALAVVEIAGKDSIAAAVQAVRADRFSALLPTIACTGTQFGDWEAPFRAAERMARLVGDAATVYPPVVLGAPPFWRALCGATHLRSLREFGFASPCTACHLYFHALRIPLALHLSSSVIVAGERASHDGKVKLSQVDVSLALFQTFVQRFGLELSMPLRYVEDTAEIDALLGGDGGEGSDQLQCVLSGNYRDDTGRVRYEPQEVRRFLEDVALPVAERWLLEWVPS
ncbi:MAG: hypothetical protein K9L28_06820 [Synergistales bacterium]|nr:hypothetical protein [Synergistales bacterium]